MEIEVCIFLPWGAFHQGLRQWQSNQQRQDFNKKIQEPISLCHVGKKKKPIKHKRIALSSRSPNILYLFVQYSYPQTENSLSFQSILLKYKNLQNSFKEN